MARQRIDVGADLSPIAMRAADDHRARAVFAHVAEIHGPDRRIVAAAHRRGAGGRQ